MINESYFRRLVVTPKNKEAEKLLDYNEASDEQLYSLELKKPFFDELCNMKIFDNLNRIANVNIDDYEDEKIIDLKIISKIILYLNDKKFSKEFESDSSQFLQMFKYALENNTGVYFFF